MFSFVRVPMVVMSLHSNRTLTKTHIRPSNNYIVKQKKNLILKNTCEKKHLKIFFLKENLKISQDRMQIRKASTQHLLSLPFPVSAVPKNLLYILYSLKISTKADGKNTAQMRKCKWWQAISEFLIVFWERNSSPEGHSDACRKWVIFLRMKKMALKSSLVVFPYHLPLINIYMFIYICNTNFY